jgi:hypothetical protein
VADGHHGIPVLVQPGEPAVLQADLRVVVLRQGLAVDDPEASSKTALEPLGLR